VPGTLALDPARRLGWAYCAEPGGLLEFGHRMLAREGAEPGEIGDGLSVFLHHRIDEFQPALIVYEQPFLSRNFQTSFVLLGLGFSIDTIARQCRIEYGSVLAQEATKAMTGRAKFPGKDYAERRKAKKAATMHACWARGWKATEDEADAIAVLLLAEAKRFPEAAMSRPKVLKAPSGPLFRNPEIEQAIRQSRVRRIV
jgi:Holliday junction resolvasome RuvABC endonuclease subunit